MAGAPVLEDKDSLPCSQLKFPVHNWNRLARSREHRSNVGRHIVATFGAMLEIARVLRNELVEERLEVVPGCWIGIFHHNQAAAGVLHEYRDGTAFDPAVSDSCRDFVTN